MKKNKNTKEINKFFKKKINKITKGKTKEYRKMVKEELWKRYKIENYYDEIDIWVIKCNVKTGIIRMYERYTGRNVENEMGLTPAQLCQKENAENLNKLIQKYFYELNDE